MTIDSSIALQAQTPQTGLGNALAPFLQILQAKNLMNQQAMFQQQFAARQAIGPILQQSIDPQTGEVDYDKAFKMAAANPQTAFMAGDLLNQGIQRQQTQANITKINLENAKSHLDNIGGIATGLLSQATQTQGPDGQPVFNLDPSKVQEAVTNGVKNGLIPADMAQQITSNLSSDPTALYQKVKQFALQSNAHSDQLNSILGKIEHIDTGGGTRIVSEAPGAVNPLTTLGIQPKSATPGELLNPQQVINPLTKETQVVPAGRLFGNMQGNVPAMQGVGSAGGGNTPIAPSNALIGATQSQPAALRPANAFPLAAPAGNVTSAAPGDIEAEKDFKSSYAPQVANLAANVNQQRLILGEIQGKLNEVKQNPDLLKNTVGPGADLKNLVARFLTAVPGSNPDWINKNLQNVSDYSQLRSMMQDVVIPQARLMFGTAGSQHLPVGEYAPFSDAHINTNTPESAVEGLLSYYGKLGGLSRLTSDFLNNYLDAASNPAERSKMFGQKYLSQNQFIHDFTDYLHSKPGQARLSQYGVIGSNE
jgi:hypothetical protein